MAAALSATTGQRECKYGLLWLSIVVLLARNIGGKFIIIKQIIIYSLIIIINLYVITRVFCDIFGG